MPSVRTASFAANLAILERFETVAERLAADGDAEGAVAAVELGAIVAGARHPGVHASHRMEHVLERIAAEHLEPLPPRRARPAVERVLHIVTETYQVGGHSRMIWRWIERDGERAHTVVTTRQRAAAAAGVGKAARASGGALVELDHRAPSLDRARAVRALLADADVVVLHAHPNDPVPVLALAAAGERPPVVFFNHCDHLFWLGASVTDALYSLRPAGVKLGLRRGIAAGRQLQGPAPVAGQDGNGPIAGDRGVRSRARAELLRQRGWPADTVLMLSVGAGYKFGGDLGTSLLDLVAPVVDANAHVGLLAIGPMDEGAWREAHERTAGRIFALGPKTGLGPVFAAADIYLESRPGGGPGASSEAAAHGLPVLTHAESLESAELHTTDAGYGASLELGADAYRARLQQLIDSAELRAEFGENARASVAATDAAWPAAVERAYALAASAGRASASELVPVPDVPDLYDELIEVESRTRQPVGEAVAKRLVTSLELAQRCPAVRALYGPGLEVASGPKSVIGAVFCAPSPAPEELRAAIEEFRRLAIAGVSARFVLAMTPEDAEPAIPILEDALAEGAEMPVDLVIDAAPQTARPDGAMELVLGEPDTPLAPYQYACPLPAVAAL